MVINFQRNTYFWFWSVVLGRDFCPDPMTRRSRRRRRPLYPCTPQWRPRRPCRLRWRCPFRRMIVVRIGSGDGATSRAARTWRLQRPRPTRWWRPIGRPPRASGGNCHWRRNPLPKSLWNTRHFVYKAHQTRARPICHECFTARLINGYMEVH